LGTDALPRSALASGVALALLLALLVSLPLHARHPDPIARKTRDTVPRLAAASLARGNAALLYDLLWHGNPAGTLRVDADILHDAQRPLLRVRCELATVPALEPIWGFEASATTLMEPATHRPVRAELTTRRPRREKRSTMLFDWDTGTARLDEVKPHRIASSVVPLEDEFDPLSALVHLSSVSPPCVLRVLVRDDLYKLTVSRTGEQTARVPAGTFNAEQWDVVATEVTGETSPQEEPPARCTAWVFGEHRLPVRAEAGPVAAELRGVGP
jgi:hypothetical protein